MSALARIRSVAKITLDAETFKALASATRLTVLRALDERRKTLTELARDLGLNKATVHEHLQLLGSADLVRKRDDEGRKWIYYELTWRGQRLLHPQETTTFSVLLGLSAAAAGGGIAMLGRALGWWLQQVPVPTEKAPAPPSAGTPPGLAADQANDTATPPVGMEGAGEGWGDDGWLAVGLLGLAALGTVLAAALRRRLRPARFTPPERIDPQQDQP